jgi:hypothetical protein
MASSAVRPHTKLAAAMLAAGIVSGATVVAMPEQHLPTVTADVANASFVTDALRNFGLFVNYGAGGAAVATEGALALPFDAALGLVAAQNNPSASTGIVSDLINRYVNPSPKFTTDFTYPELLLHYYLPQIASMLPFPLGPNATDAGVIMNIANAYSDAVNDALKNLPDAAAGRDALLAASSTDIGQVIGAAKTAAWAPVTIALSTVAYLGNLPATLEASVENAIRQPDQLPGLMSNLVYGLLNTSTPGMSKGFLVQLFDQIIAPIQAMPAPIGGLNSFVEQIHDSVYGAINNFLAGLPAPVTPVAFGDEPAASSAPGGSAAASTASPSAVPAARLALTSAAVNVAAAAPSTATAVETTATSVTAATTTEAKADDVTSGDTTPAAVKSAETSSDDTSSDDTKVANAKPTDGKASDDASTATRSDAGKTAATSRDSGASRGTRAGERATASAGKPSRAAASASKPGKAASKGGDSASKSSSDAS